MTKKGTSSAWIVGHVGLVDSINDEIAKRTKYGYRTEVAKKPGWILIWSNGSHRWHRFNRVKKGESLKLDANHILVTGITSKELDALTDQKGALDSLPLYGNSYEATRGLR